MQRNAACKQRNAMLLASNASKQPTVPLSMQRKQAAQRFLQATQSNAASRQCNGASMQSCERAALQATQRCKRAMKCGQCCDLFASIASHYARKMCCWSVLLGFCYGDASVASDFMRCRSKALSKPDTLRIMTVHRLPRILRVAVAKRWENPAPRTS